MRVTLSRRPRKRPSGCQNIYPAKHQGKQDQRRAPHSAGEQKAPAVQRLYRLHTKALSAWSTFGSATRICGAFATLVRNHSSRPRH